MIRDFSGALGVQAVLAQKRHLQRELLKWFRRSGRDLPWRRTQDPYAIWVSEVMLQQTQVQTVIPYYTHFLRSFPSIRDLAQANLQTVLRAWAGLGYYSRARRLHDTAVKIVQEYDGEFPDTYGAVSSLPGVGRYTASAILSLAFNQPFPVVDGNVTRVLSRVFLLTGTPSTAKFQKEIWNLAGQLLPRRTPGDFNQALMELGATVCSPAKPQCLSCPWQKCCQARLSGQQEQVPERKRALPVKLAQRGVAVIQHRGRFLILKRTGEKVLNDLWEFPEREFNNVRDLPHALRQEVFSDLGLDIDAFKQLAVFKHSITRHRLTMHVFLGRLCGGGQQIDQNKKARWIRLAEADRFPFGAVSRRILEILKKRI